RALADMHRCMGTRGSGGRVRVRPGERGLLLRNRRPGWLHDHVVLCLRRDVVDRGIIHGEGVLLGLVWRDLVVARRPREAVEIVVLEVLNDRTAELGRWRD